MKLLEDFEQLVSKARAVREFSEQKIPAEVIERCLEIALQSPSSSNLQPWNFIWVQSAEKKQKIAEICLSQKSVLTASDLIVLVARPDIWKQNAIEIIEKLKVADATKFPQIKNALRYFQVTVPNTYDFKFGYLKWVRDFFVGRTKPIFRGMYTKMELRNWSIKSCGLAAETLLLAINAAGFETCPIEGFDVNRLRKQLELTPDSYPVLVVAAGKIKNDITLNPRVRCDKNRLIIKI